MKLGHNYYVYIVECRDGSYYIGVTSDIDRRMWEHNTGHDPGCYTYDKSPVELKYFEHYTDVNQAISREKQLKGWSRKKKQALFREDWNELKLYLNLQLSEEIPTMLRQAQHDNHY